MRRLSLRARLLIGVVALAAVGLVVANAVTYGALRSYLVSQVDTTLQNEHQAFEVRDGGSPPGIYSEFRAYDGRTVIPPGLTPPPVYGGEAREAPPVLPPTISVAAQPNEGPDRVSYFTVGSRNSDEQYRVRASIEPELSGEMLIVAVSLHDVENTLHRLLLVEFLVTLAVLAALAILASWIIRIGLRPLTAIEETAVAITAGDLSLRVEHPDPGTEVGRLGAALNTMLDRIEASDKRLRRFVGDASHELRTPLAAVRAYAELFGRGASARPDDLERSMTGITRETERMSVLVDDLLLLARLDEGRPLEQKPVDFAAVVSEAVDAARAVEPERPIDVTLEAATITGDGGRLRQVVDNLFANVRAHTPAGTPVSVELHAVKNQAELTVADHGPGLAEDDAAKIFERFYRVDTSRARASGGVGLGLYIVAAVVAAHGGSVSAEPTPGGGATFVIALPLAGE